MAQLGYPTESSQLTSTTYRDFSSPPPKHEWISGAYQEAQEGSQHEGQRPRPKSVGWVSRSKRTLSAQKKKKKGYKCPKQSLINVKFQNARNKEKRLQLSGGLVGRYGIKNQFAYVELGLRDFRILKIIPAARRP